MIASSSVESDAGQPWQWPSSRSWATPSTIPWQLDVAAVRLHVGPHGGERLEHPGLERHRVEVVDQKQARDHAVARQPFPDLLAEGRVLGQRLHDACKPLAVEVDDRTDELLGRLLGVAVLERLQGLGQLLHALEGAAFVVHVS